MKFTNLSTDIPTWRKTPDGFLRCKARVLAERVMPYGRKEFENEFPEEAGDIILLFVSLEEMKKSIKSLEGAPVVAGAHEWLTPEVIKEFGVGQVSGAPTLDGEYLTCDLLITDPDTIQKIETKELSDISGGYHGDIFINKGDFNGTQYSAEQKNLCFNHIAILPPGHGRAGSDVRILNQKKKEDTVMPVRIQLKNSKKFINVEEDVATAISEDQETSSKSFEDTISQLEAANAQLAEINSTVEQLKGELSAYKQKLDQLLSEEEVEKTAMGMVQEGEEANAVVDNSPILDDKGEESPEKKEEIKNSIKGLWGPKLHKKVLNSIGVKTDSMSPEAIHGAFKAQVQICNSMKGKRIVAGTKFVNGQMERQTDVAQNDGRKVRTPLEKLGFHK